MNAVLDVPQDSVAADSTGELALVLDGGGARAAWQVGVLRAFARRFPGKNFPILTGVSAGAINVAILANHPGTLSEAVDDLSCLWAGLEISDILRTDGISRLRWLVQTVAHVLLGVASGPSATRGLLDTSAMRSFLHDAMRTRDGSLPGITENLRTGRLSAVALTATRYATGEAVSFCAGRPTESWDQPQLRAVTTVLRVDHVMASSALPLAYPAVAVDGLWYGDGEIALETPLAPALHLGADRILVISAWADRGRWAGARPLPPATHPTQDEIMGVLYDAVFTNRLARDARHLNRVNRIVRGLEAGGRHGLREVKLMVIRPSCDLGAVACEPGVEVPEALRFLTKRLDLGRESARNVLSVVMLQSVFLRRLIEIGEGDGDRRADDLAAFMDS